MFSPRKIGLAALTLIAMSFLMVLCTPGRSGENTNVTTPQADTTTSESAAANSEAAATPTGTAAPEPPTATALPPTLTPTVTPIPVHEVTMSFSGDVLSHSGVYNKARSFGGSDWEYDYRPMFAEVADRLLAADLALCVLETPVSPDNTALSGYPTFNAPRELPAALAEVGFDGCATASNHSFDQGVAGVTATLEEMDRAGLGHAGMARTKDEQESIRIYRVNDVVIAHLSWTYGLNGYVLPEDQPWLVNVTDAGRIVEQAAQAKAGGADLVVLSIQWGNEYVTEPTANQLDLSVALTSSGDIDLIVGNHAHVVQPIDVVNDTPIIYGLGNFLSNQSAECCPARSQDGVMIELTFRGSSAIGWEVADLVAIPTWVERSTYTIVSLPDALASGDLDAAARQRYETSFSRTMETLQSLNAEVRAAE